MDSAIRYVVQNDKKLKYALLALGTLLLLYGMFRDSSWLTGIRDCMAMNGICVRSRVLNFASIIITSAGCLFTAVALRGGPAVFVSKNRFELFLEIAIFVLMVLFLISSQVRFLDNDEYEHLHNAWLMIEGTIPYFSLKFWHAPLLEWIIAFFMGITGENTIIMQVMRLFIFCVSCGSLLLVYLISKELYQSRNQALIAVLLIVSNYVWILKSPEIRPDNLMLFFALLSFWFLVKYYAHFQAKYLLICVLCAVLSMLGKQNAAVFYLPVGLVFAYDYFVWRRRGGLKVLIMGIVAIGLLLLIDPVRSFLMINIDRHLVSHSWKTSPNGFLGTALGFNPAVFILFVLQFFFSFKLPDRYKPFRYYLLAVPIVCFVFLYIMNRPLYQEMLVMIVFMSIGGANVLVSIVRKFKWKLEYIVAGVIMLPVFYYMPTTGLAKTWIKDLHTTKMILRMSRGDDLVYDSFGKPIFRHSPMEPNYLMYRNQSRNFKRLKELKESGVKFLVVDGYTNYLPLETRKWFYDNFRPSKVDPNIWVRRKE